MSDNKITPNLSASFLHFRHAERLYYILVAKLVLLLKKIYIQKKNPNHFISSEHTDFFAEMEEKFPFHKSG